MAFCSKCGAQLEGNERFCVKCGNDLSVAGATSNEPVAAAVPAALNAPDPGAPPVVLLPHAFPGPAPIPIPMAPPVQAKGRGWLWGVILAAVLGYGYYYYTQHQQTQTPEQNPAQQPGTGGQQPSQPGTNPGRQPVQGQQPGTTPSQQPAPAPEPGQAPQPPVPGGQGGNAGLVRLQQFAGRWIPVNGMIEVANAVWRNNSNVAIQSAMLECDQYAVNGRVITQSQIRLNGPVQPGGADSFQPFMMGAISPYMSRVNCGIVAVTPVN